MKRQFFAKILFTLIFVISNLFIKAEVHGAECKINAYFTDLNFQRLSTNNLISGTKQYKAVADYTDCIGITTKFTLYGGAYGNLNGTGTGVGGPITKANEQRNADVVFSQAGDYYFSVFSSFGGGARSQTVNVVNQTCKVSVSFDVNPKEAPYNKPVVLSGTVSLSGSTLGAPGTSSEGYCQSSNGAAVSTLFVEFNMPQLGSIQIPVEKNTIKSYSFSKSFNPTDLGYKVLDQKSFFVEVWPNNKTNGGNRFAVSSSVSVKFTNGIYQAYGCVADDGKYACSQSGLSNCSDVSACGGKQCKVLSDSNLCGKLASSNPDTGAQTTSPVNNTNPTNSTSTTTGSIGGNSSTSLYNPLPENDLINVFLILLQWMLGIIGILAVVFIVVGGAQMILAAGNEEAIGKAKKTISASVMGLVIALLSFSIIAIVQQILQADIKTGQITNQTKLTYEK